MFSCKALPWPGAEGDPHRRLGIRQEGESHSLQCHIQGFFFNRPCNCSKTGSGMWNIRQTGCLSKFQSHFWIANEGGCLDTGMPNTSPYRGYLCRVYIPVSASSSLHACSFLAVTITALFSYTWGPFGQHCVCLHCIGLKNSVWLNNSVLWLWWLGMEWLTYFPD